MKFPIEVKMNPAIFNCSLTGKTYIVAGQWIEVPKGTKFSEMGKYVTYKVNQDKPRVWQVKSASSGSTYTIRRYGEGRFSCDCVGFKFHGKCKHVAKVIADLR